MELRQDAAWAMITPTSMGVRITPDNGQPVHSSRRFTMHATSAETNVASIASHLGLPVKVLTTFVEGSPIAQIIKSDLAARHMAYEGPEVPQGGAWGYRHQFNIADSGAGNRGPRVHNDRAGEVGRTLSVADFDLDRILGTEGAQILHLSGVIAALSPEASTFCLELARAAKRQGTRISFDINYRASFWEGREADLGAVFSEIAGVSDILIGNEEDFQLALGIAGPEAGGAGLTGKIDGFKEMIGRVQAAYPQRLLVRQHPARGGQRQPTPVGWPDPRRWRVPGGRAPGHRRARPDRRWRRLRRRDALRHPARLGAGALPAVRLGQRRPGCDLPDRLRRPCGRGPDLEHLGRQRPRAPLTYRPALPETRQGDPGAPADVAMLIKRCAGPPRFPIVGARRIGASGSVDVGVLCGEGQPLRAALGLAVGVGHR